MDIAFEPLPLVIGVTGHRDLREEDLPRLTQALEAVFDQLEEEYANPASPFERIVRLFWPSEADRLRLRDRRRKQPGVTPMVVLSALAEGADQLVARVAERRGLRVIAPLPLPVEKYRRDFERNPVRPDALKQFDEWMEPRSGVIKLFVEYEDGVSEVNLEVDQMRDLQYRRAGAFIARHCDVLIALWDGRDRAAPGGTAEIVDFKRHGIPLDVSRSGRASLDAPEIGPVINIVTPRAAKTPTAEEVTVKPWGVRAVGQALADRKQCCGGDEEIEALELDYELWKFFGASIRQTREFNRDAVPVLQSPDGPAKVEDSVFRLLEADPLDAEARARACETRDAARWYCDLHAVADILAQRWQVTFQNDWHWLFALGLFAFASFEAYAHLAPIIEHEWPGIELVGTVVSAATVDRVLLFGYIVALSAIFARAYVAKRRQHQERFLDYRAFAEALRVAVFWRLAGIERVADAYPVKMPRELAWVKTCLLGLELLDQTDPARIAPAHGSQPDYGWICDTWVKGQLSYFDGARSRHVRNAEWREGWSKWLLAVTAALAATLLAVVLEIAGNDAYGEISQQLSRGEWGHDLFLFVIAIVPGVAAFFIGQSEKLAFQAQARHYDRMAAMFGQAVYIIPQALANGRADLVHDAMRVLGIEAMRENAEWVSMYRNRPIGPTQP